jgi:hypothetical protein
MNRPPPEYRRDHRERRLAIRDGGLIWISFSDNGSTNYRVPAFPGNELRRKKMGSDPVFQGSIDRRAARLRRQM